jgi:hypothetical protein
MDASRGAGVLALVILLAPCASSAQSKVTFTGRLTPVPIDPISAQTTTGLGAVTAVLEGTTLKITGKFDGMNSPAQAAHIHRAPKGLRGQRVFDLTVTKDKRGTVEGSLKLSSSQVEDLNKGWYYVQIHTERNPEGHLRGWLLK